MNFGTKGCMYNCGDECTGECIGVETKTKMSKKDYKTLLDEQTDRLDDFKNAMLVSNLRDSSTRQYFTEWFNHIVQKSIELDETNDELINKRIK